MLARRFTLVCLLIALFGMGMSVLVAEKSRPGYAQSGNFFACDIANTAACTLRTQR